MIFGVAFYAYSFGNVAQMISDFDKDNEEYQNQVSTLRFYARHNRLSTRLVNRIERHMVNQIA